MTFSYVGDMTCSLININSKQWHNAVTKYISVACTFRVSTTHGFLLLWTSLVCIRSYRRKSQSFCKNNTSNWKSFALSNELYVNVIGLNESCALVSKITLITKYRYILKWLTPFDHLQIVVCSYFIAAAKLSSNFNNFN